MGTGVAKAHGGRVAHPLSSAPWAAARRLAALWVSALACGVASALVALMHRGGEGLSAVAFDPITRGAALLFVLLGSGLGLWVALFTLWNVRLTRAIPVVFLGTVVATHLGAAGGGSLLGALAGVVAGVATMLVCGSLPRWRLPDAP